MASSLTCALIRLQYSLAGDDSVTEAVTDLVRGTLCPALKAIFLHGLKKPSILGGPCHPWLFIEEVGDLLVFISTCCCGQNCCDLTFVFFFWVFFCRQPAEKWKETSTLFTQDWCSVKPTGTTNINCIQLN